VDALTAAAIRLWSDRSLAERIGQQSRAHVEANYTWERSGASLIAVYRESGVQPIADRA
jgi:glycosyltransferase involved in cell wall biosynthesis